MVWLADSLLDGAFSESGSAAKTQDPRIRHADFSGIYRLLARLYRYRIATGLRKFEFMRLGRKSVGWVAIYAIALHAILWGVAPMAAAPSLDPLSVICHSEPATPAEQSPAAPAPAHTCDHCNVCNTAPTPTALDSTVTEQLAPARLLQILLPTSTAVRGYLATTPHLARGPPAFA